MATYNAIFVFRMSHVHIWVAWKMSKFGGEPIFRARCSTPHSVIKYSVSISFWHFCEISFGSKFWFTALHSNHHHHHHRLRHTLNVVKANGAKLLNAHPNGDKWEKPFFFSLIHTSVHSLLHYYIADYFLRFVSMRSHRRTNIYTRTVAHTHQASQHTNIRNFFSLKEKKNEYEYATWRKCEHCHVSVPTMFPTFSSSNGNIVPPPPPPTTKTTIYFYWFRNARQGKKVQIKSKNNNNNPCAMVKKKEIHSHVE